MKKTTVTLVLALFAFLATAAFAQANISLRTDVPFAFSVEGRPYAAGPYELRAIRGSTVQLLDMDTGHAGLVRVICSEQAGSGRNRTVPVLRFALNRGRAYLISLTDVDGNGWKVPVASKDMEALRDPQSKHIVVALK